MDIDMTEQNKFIFYAAKEGDLTIKVFVEDESIWVTQAGMTEIFDVSKSTISEHLTNIFKEGELVEDSVVRKIRTTASDGKPYNVSHYNLDAIISVGYRVNSYRATQFRIWATSTLKEYLIKGFAMDDERLKQGKTLFGKDYFDELLERIRQIRASEKRLYLKVTGIYEECSYDYDKNSPITSNFYANVQNKLLFAVSGQTAAEIKKLRADYNLPNMGLTTWENQNKGGKVTKKDIDTAKNYLTEDEIDKLNRLVNMFLDHAENIAKNNTKMAMQDWVSRLDKFIEFNEYEILKDYEKITKTLADAWVNKQYDKFKPIQEKAYKSDFEKAVDTIKSTGSLPKEERKRLASNIKGFDSKLKKALDYNPKDSD